MSEKKSFKRIVGETIDISKYTNDKHLSFKKCSILDSSYFSKFSHIIDLELISSKIDSLSIFSNIYSLERLNLHDNNISEINISKIPNLYHLNLGKNKIRTLITSEFFINIKQLNVDNNDLQSLEGLYNFPSLKDLSAINNKIDDIHDILYCKSIETLELQYNNIEDISPIGQLKTLIEINFTSNQIKEIPDLNLLNNLRIVIIENNHITSLTSISSNIKIVTLVAKNNEIEDLSSIKNLTSISRIDLSYNKITDITDLPKDKISLCNLNHNNIKKIENLFEMKFVKHLNLSNNKIRWIKGSQNLILESLLLEGNDLQDLSFLTMMISLKLFSINVKIYKGINSIIIRKLTNNNNIIIKDGNNLFYDLKQDKYNRLNKAIYIITYLLLNYDGITPFPSFEEVNRYHKIYKEDRELYTCYRLKYLEIIQLLILYGRNYLPLENQEETFLKFKNFQKGNIELRIVNMFKIIGCEIAGLLA